MYVHVRMRLRIRSDWASLVCSLDRYNWLDLYTLASNWRGGIIITLYKGKGPKSDCSSYRPITLLSVPGKVLAHVLLAPIQPLLDMM